MKYGDKIYTYKDIEEAKKLIGKKIIASDSLQDIEDPDVLSTVTCTLCKVEDFKMFPYRYHTSLGTQPCQFIREVIDEEPQYRAFTPEELAEQVGKIVRKKGTNNRHLITDYQEIQHSFMSENAIEPDVKVANLGRKTARTLLKDFEFLDGSPCGVEVKE